METAIQLHALSALPQRTEEIVRYFWEKWGSPENEAFYRDAIVHSTRPDTPLPKFFVAIREERIIGCVALLTNDLVSRQDLWPWLACLYVEPAWRNKGLGTRLSEHACHAAREAGYNHLYLTTDQVGYYEKSGWQRTGEAYNLAGEAFRLYSKKLG